MIPDFPHIIRIRLAQLNFFLLLLDIAKSLPCWLSQFRKATQGRDLATSGHNKKIQIGPILFLCYKESLVSSNLNSNKIRFHGAHPNIYAIFFKTC